MQNKLSRVANEKAIESHFQSKNMKSDFQAYGIKEANTLASKIDLNIEEIIVNGFTVVNEVLEVATLDETRQRIDAVYDVQTAEIGGPEKLKQINDESVARCMLAYDDYFLQIATNAKVLAILQKLLGDYFTLCQQNAIINLPNQKNYQTSWHRDLIYQHFVPSRPVAVSALFCIDDFSEITGGTHVLRASHKLEKFPSQEFVQKHEHAMVASAGSAIVFDSMLFHRGGFNSSSQTRRGLNHLYAMPFIKQQVNLPQILKGKYSDDGFLSRFLGYESEPAADVRQWRLKRLERLQDSAGKI
jgi:ectoine hydroxylase-related dioxygenase (phytanoyl-CoA dioxygenase family)